MNSVFKKLAFIAALAVTVVAQDDLVVDTPLNVVVCRPIRITFQGGEPPYFLTIRPGNQPTGAQPLHDFGELETNSPITWVANLPPGTSGGLDLRDSSGRFVQSGPFDVLTGPDTSCVGQEPSTSAGPSSSASSGSSSGSASTPSGTSSAPPASSTPPTSAAPTSRSTSVAPGVSSRTPSSSTPGASQTPADDGAASSNYVPAALAGLAGAAAVLLA